MPGIIEKISESSNRYAIFYLPKRIAMYNVAGIFLYFVAGLTLVLSIIWGDIGFGIFSFVFFFALGRVYLWAAERNRETLEKLKEREEKRKAEG